MGNRPAGEGPGGDPGPGWELRQESEPADGRLGVAGREEVEGLIPPNMLI